MSRRFEIGDHVRWNSEAGHVSGKIIKMHTRDTRLQGDPRTPARMIHSTRSRATRPTTSPCTRARRCTRSTERCVLHHAAARSPKGRRAPRSGRSATPPARWMSSSTCSRTTGSKRSPMCGAFPVRADTRSTHQRPWHRAGRAGIAYQWIPALGGRRRPRSDSPNTAWRNAAFRGYADHIGSAEFAQGFAELLEFCPPAHNAHVRRGAVVALPSGADRRRAVHPRHRGGTYPRRKAHRRSPLHVGGADRARPPEL